VLLWDGLSEDTIQKKIILQRPNGRKIKLVKYIWFDRKNNDLQGFINNLRNSHQYRGVKGVFNSCIDHNLTVNEF